MGWASGSGIADEVWGIVREFVPQHHRKHVAKEIIEVFEHEDADDFDDSFLICQDAEYGVYEDDELDEEDEV